MSSAKPIEAQAEYADQVTRRHVADEQFLEIVCSAAGPFALTPKDITPRSLGNAAYLALYAPEKWRPRCRAFYDAYVTYARSHNPAPVYVYSGVVGGAGGGGHGWPPLSSVRQ